MINTTLIILVLLLICLIAFGLYISYQILRSEKTYEIRVKWIYTDDPRLSIYSSDYIYKPSKHNWYGFKFPEEDDYKLEKPYKKIEPTDTDIDYSHCYLPFFDSKQEGWDWYNENVISLEEAIKLRDMGFSNPTRMAWYIDNKVFWKNPQNHNDSNVKISLPTREQADCFLNSLLN